MKKVFLSFSILLFISMCLWAQNVPQTIDYQGRLADSDGNYLNNVVTVNFLIYDAEFDGTLLWNETQDVSTSNGIFHVLLGSVTSFPTDLFDNANRWLELIVSGETLSPSTVIASVPYSIKAETAYSLDNMGSGSGLDADLLDGQDSSDFMPASTTWGDITAVTAGTGLNGGGASGAVTLNVNVPLNLSGNVSFANSIIKGENTGTGFGVYGKHNSSGNYGNLGSSNMGVYGKHNSSGNYGYLASSDYGVYGRNYVSDGCGVYGYNTASNGYAVYGNSTGYYGGYFNANYNSSSTKVLYSEFVGAGTYDAIAIYGRSRPIDYYGYGGYFEGGYSGVVGLVAPTGNHMYHGVYGYVYGGSGTNYAIYAYAGGGSINYAGYFSGNVHVTGTFSNPSDERFKENMQPFSNALSKIKLMNVHTFNFKQMAEEKQLVLPEGEQIGLIAQELENILPELVVDNIHAYDKNEGIEGAEKDMEKIEYKGINYIGLIPVLIEAMKEQQQQIEELKQQIAELK